MTTVSFIYVFWSAQSEDGYEPLVAFLCNRPAMYLTESGWTSDDKNDCITEPTQILDYCKKVILSRQSTSDFQILL